MRLSDAMALGRTIEVPGDAYSFESCAVGIGMAAFGIEKGHRGIEATERFPWLEDIDPKSPNESEFYKSFRWTISKWYFGVSRGEMTFDELIDKVRAIEPPESTTETTIEDIPMVEAAK